MFYQKVTDIYATSIDYDPSAETTLRFFQTVQNKMHWAAHGQTAAEAHPGQQRTASPGRAAARTRPGLAPESWEQFAQAPHFTDDAF